MDADCLRTGVSPWTQTRRRNRGIAACRPSDATTSSPHHAHRALDDLDRIVNDRAGARPRRQRSVGLVRAIGKSLGRDAQATRLAGAPQAAPSPAARNDERAIECGDSARAIASARRDRAPPCCRALRAPSRAAARHPSAARNRRQRADLGEHHVLDLRGAAHLAPPESRQSGKPGCAPTATPASRASRTSAHHGRIAAWEPQAMFAEVMCGMTSSSAPIAMGPERFAHVAVEIDGMPTSLTLGPTRRERIGGLRGLSKRGRESTRAVQGGGVPARRRGVIMMLRRGGRPPCRKRRPNRGRTTIRALLYEHDQLVFSNPAAAGPSIATRSRTGAVRIRCSPAGAPAARPLAVPSPRRRRC